MKSPEHPEETLLFQCLELPKDAREAFLDSVCHDKPELRRRVLRLLKSHETGGGFLDSVEESLDEGEVLEERSIASDGEADLQQSKNRAQATSLLRYRIRKACRNYGPFAIALGFVGIVLYVFVTYESGDSKTADNSRKVANIDRSFIAILPFETQATDPRESALAKSLRMHTHGWLEQIDGLRLVAADDVKESSLNRVRELGAGSVVQGGVQIAGDRARLRVELVDASNASTIWSAAYTCFLGEAEPLLISKGIGLELANALAAQIVPSAPEMPRPLSHSVEAAEAYHKGMDLLDTGSLTTMPQAIQFFEEAIRLDPNFADAYLALGNAHHRREQLTPDMISEVERIANMRSAAERALVIDPQSPEARVLMGVAWKLEGNRNRALKAFEEALRIDPNCAVAHMEIAQWEFDMRIAPWDPAYDQHMETLLERIQKAIDRDPDNPRYHYERGQVFSYLGEAEKSSKTFEQAIQLNPRYVDALHGLAQSLYYFMGRFDESIVLMRSAIALDPLRIQIYIDLSLCYENIGDFSTAALWKERIIRLRPDLAPINMGDVHRLRGREDEAIEEYQAIFEGDLTETSLDTIRRRLLNHDLRTGNFAGAKDRYYSTKDYMSWGLPLFDSDPQVNSHLEALFAMEIAPIRMALGETEAANQLLDGSWIFFESIPKSIHIRAFYETLKHVMKGEDEAAIETLRQAVENGYRSRLDFGDARLDSLRNRPGFVEIQRIVDEDMARQLANIRVMEANGELAPLPDELR